MSSVDAYLFVCESIKSELARGNGFAAVFTLTSDVRRGRALVALSGLL